MSAATILFGVPASLISSDDEVIIKPVLSEDINESAQVTSHAVEDGADVSDHVDPGNSTLSLSTVLVREMNLLGEAIFGADKSPEEKIIMLKKWKENGELLTYSGPVFKGIGVFKQGIDIEMKNLVITSQSFKRDNTTGGGFNATLTLQQLKIAYAKETVATLPKAAKSTTKKGPTETTTGSSTQKKSILSQWVNK